VREQKNSIASIAGTAAGVDAKKNRVNGSSSNTTDQNADL
jgi:hypothetical protein